MCRRVIVTHFIYFCKRIDKENFHCRGRCPHRPVLTTINHNGAMRASPLHKYTQEPRKQANPKNTNNATTRTANTKNIRPNTGGYFFIYIIFYLFNRISKPCRFFLGNFKLANAHNSQNQCRCKPAYGINRDQHSERLHLSEHGINPQNAKSARACHRHKRRFERIAESAHTARKIIHNTAHKMRTAHHREPFATQFL